MKHEDQQLYQYMEAEYARQQWSLMMVAASSIARPSTLACEGTSLINTTTEGYPGARYHAGCSVVDKVERLAVERACGAFRAQYANVQPHSGSSANLCLITAFLEPGDTILSLDLDCGGHLTHGSRASVVGKMYNVVRYGVDDRSLIDYDEVSALANAHNPALIICGASAYPRTIEFSKFREIADQVDALLLADISHIAGLVVAGHHPSPINFAHFTTTSTYKQLYGPRGGLILMGEDATSTRPGKKSKLSDEVQRAVFPFFQGTPHLATIAAKAHALERVRRPEFVDLSKRIIDDARALADQLIRLKYRVLTNGTDNHMVLIDIAASGLTGAIAESALERCGVIINRNRIPGDKLGARITSGIRLGTNIVAYRGLEPREMEACGSIIHFVLSSIRPKGAVEYTLDEAVIDDTRERVTQICRAFPLPEYPIARLDAENGARGVAG